MGVIAANQRRAPVSALRETKNYFFIFFLARKKSVCYFHARR